MKALILHGGDNSISQSPSCVQLRDDLIGSTDLIGAINSIELLEIATASVKDIKAMVRAVESNRAEVKAPVLALAGEIDETAKAFVRPLLLELVRLESSIGVYSREQQRIRDEAARQLRVAQEAESARVRAIQEAELRRIRDEAARQQREAEAKRQADIAAARSESEARRIQAEADYAREQSERAAAAASVAANTAAAVSLTETQDLFVAPVAPKVPLKTVVKFEVQDVAEVLLTHPQLIRWEANVAEFNKLLASGCRDIPGCRIWEEQEVRIR